MLFVPPDRAEIGKTDNRLNGGFFFPRTLNANIGHTVERFLKNSYLSDAHSSTGKKSAWPKARTIFLVSYLPRQGTARWYLKLSHRGRSQAALLCLFLFFLFETNFLLYAVVEYSVY